MVTRPILGTETFEPGDEALDENSRSDSDLVEDLEEDPSLDRKLQVDERELEEVGTEFDDPGVLVASKEGWTTLMASENLRVVLALDVKIMRAGTSTRRWRLVTRLVRIRPIEVFPSRVLSFTIASWARRTARTSSSRSPLSCGMTLKDGRE